MRLIERLNWNIEREMEWKKDRENWNIEREKEKKRDREKERRKDGENKEKGEARVLYKQIAEKLER